MPLVLRELLCGSTRFNDLHRGVPLMSRSLLSGRLKRLEEIGAVVRKRGPDGPEYHLTESGRDFAPIVEQLGQWGQRWYRSRFTRDELDVGVLMWALRRRVDSNVFPPERIAVQFDFSDQPASKRSWWLVCEDGQIDICSTDPGFEVGLYVATDLRTMTRVYMGDLPVPTAVRSAAIKLSGLRELSRRFERWLGLSCFAGILDPRQRAHRPANRVRSAPAASLQMTD
jgi:DNA-binding HxlR family transcriptional regulator